MRSTFPIGATIAKIHRIFVEIFKLINEMKNKVILLAIAITSVFFTGCKKVKISEPGNLVPKTVTEDLSLPSITVNGAKFHSEAFGPPDSSIILVLHGGPAADYRYLYNCKEFGNQGFRVVFYDQRGTGLSQRFPKSHYTSLQQNYDDMNAIIAYYRTSATQKVFLLGHSWGAMLAGAYINTYPNAVNGAVLAEPGGLVWEDVKKYIKASQKMAITSEALNNATYIDQFITGKNDEHEILDYKFRMLASTGNETNITGDESPIAQWRPGAVFQTACLDIGNEQNPNWTTNLHLFTTKVLFIYSEKNSAYGLAHAQKVSAPFPNVALFKTMGAGHSMLSFPTGWNNTYPVMLNYFKSL
jgi:proline iminopeptidase